MVKTKGRKLLTLLVALAIMATMITSLSINVGATAQTQVYSTDFGAGTTTTPTNWTLVSNAGSINGGTAIISNATPPTGDSDVSASVLKFYGTPSANRGAAATVNTNISNLVQNYSVFEFDFYMTTPANVAGGTLTLGQGQQDNIVVNGVANTFFALKQGDGTSVNAAKLYYYNYNTSTWVNPTGLSINKWYKAKIYTDFKGQKVKINLTDVVASASALDSEWLNLSNTGSAPATFNKIGASYNKTTSSSTASSSYNTLIDNFKISSMEQYNANFAVTSNKGANVSNAVITVKNTDATPVTYATLTTNASGTASVSLPAGNYTYSIATGISSPLCEPITTPVAFSIASADLALPVTMTEQSEPDVVTSIDVDGGSTFLYKTASENASSSAFTAVVKNQFTATMPSETVNWSISPSITGVSIDTSTGVVSIASDANLADGSTTDVTVTATSTSKGTVTGTGTIAVRGIKKATSFTLAGPSAVAVSGAGTYSESAVADAYGETVIGYTTVWEVGTGATIDANGLLTAGAGIADVTVKATIDGVENTKAVCIANYTGTLPSGTLNTTYTFKNVNGETVIAQLIGGNFGGNNSTSDQTEFVKLESNFMLTAMPGADQIIYDYNSAGGLIGDIFVKANGTAYRRTGSSTTVDLLPSGKIIQTNKWYDVKVYVYPKISGDANGRFAFVFTGDFTNDSTDNSETIIVSPTDTRNNNFTAFRTWNLYGNANGTVLHKGLVRTGGTGATVVPRPAVTVNITGDGQVLDGATNITSGGSVTNIVGNRAFTITPTTNNKIKTVLFNGTDVTSSIPSNTYTATNVFANGTLDVTFEALPQYAVTASAGSGGNVTASQTVYQGSTATFTITPTSGYIIDTVTYNNGTTGIPVVVPMTGGDYTTPSIIANSSLTVSFVAIASSTVKHLAGEGILSVFPKGGSTATNWTIRKSVMAYATVQTTGTIIEQGMLLMDKTDKKEIYISVDTKSKSQFAVRLVNDGGLVDGRQYKIKSYVKYTDNTYSYGTEKTFTWTAE